MFVMLWQAIYKVYKSIGVSNVIMYILTLHKIASGQKENREHGACVLVVEHLLNHKYMYVIYLYIDSTFVCI